MMTTHNHGMKALPSFPGSMDNAFIATLFDWDHRTAKGWQAKANRLLRKLGVGLRLTPAPSNMANVEACELLHVLQQHPVADHHSLVVVLAHVAADAVVPPLAENLLVRDAVQRATVRHQAVQGKGFGAG